MRAADLPANAVSYRLSQVVNLHLMTRSVTCLRVAISGAVCQLLMIRPWPKEADYFDVTTVNTETGCVTSVPLRADAPVLVVPEDEGVTA